MRKFKKKILICGLCIVAGGIIIDVLLLPKVYRFLGAVQRNDSAEILVVQGWIFDTMIDQTVVEFQRGDYQSIIVSGSYAAAKWTKQRLVNKGIEESIVFEAPYPKKTSKDHTFHEAIYVKKMLDSLYPDVKAINIVTGAPHSKKTVTIFRKVLGKKIEVGIISCKETHYDSDHIWKSPHGIYNSIRFFIGYLYALVWKVEWIDG